MFLNKKINVLFLIAFSLSCKAMNQEREINFLTCTKEDLVKAKRLLNQPSYNNYCEVTKQLNENPNLSPDDKNFFVRVCELEQDNDYLKSEQKQAHQILCILGLLVAAGGFVFSCLSLK